MTLLEWFKYETQTRFGAVWKDGPNPHYRKAGPRRCHRQGKPRPVTLARDPYSLAAYDRAVTMHLEQPWLHAKPRRKLA